MSLTDNVMWEAVKRCDAGYDGQFFYAVKTTNICCRPSCKSRTPLRGNVAFYRDFSDAVLDGFRPCKRCRPDLTVPSDDHEVVQAARSIIEQEFTSALNLERLSGRVGMSKYHLQRTFKRVVGLTPMGFVTKLRMAKATELLRLTRLSVTRIAYEAGYGSLSHFHVTFRQYVGCSPSEYRQQVQHPGGPK